MITENQFNDGYNWAEFLAAFPEQQAMHAHNYNVTGATDNDRTIFNKFDRLNILVLTVPHCSDSMSILPVLARWVDGRNNVRLSILERDDHPQIMDQHLTNGARAVPKVIFLNEQFNELGSWGPRPGFIQNIFESYREQIKNGEIEKTKVTQMLRKEYARDRGRTMINEWVGILKAVLANVG